MDFVPHLEELRKRLLLWAVIFSIAAVTAYFFSRQILDFLTEPLRQYTHAALYFQKPYEAFVVHIKIAAFTGFVITSPLLLIQLWFFAAPGLYEKEKKTFLPVALISSVLFLVGVVFSYTMVIPWGLGIMLSFQTESMRPMLTVGSYFSFLTGMMIAFGILFDFPVVMVGLVELGVVETKTLAQSRRPIIVIIFIVAAVLTPSPDPISQILLALPLWALFEISLLVAGHREKSRRR